LEGAFGRRCHGAVAFDLVFDLAGLEDDLLKFRADEAVEGLDLMARESSKSHPGLQASRRFSLRQALETREILHCLSRCGCGE
jgi:hypothetical protein